MSSVTKEQLIKDITELGKTGIQITRNYYRANGKYTESEWGQYFPRFENFLEAAGLIEPETIQQSDEITADTRVITLPKTRIETLEELVEHCKIDLSIWEVEKFIANKWEMGYVSQFNGEASTIPLFQIKAFLKKKKDVLAVKKELDELKKLGKSFAKIPKPIIRASLKSGNMLEINIPDTHFGKLAWGVETGYQNFDIKIAGKMFLRAFDTLLDRVKGYAFDSIIIVLGNDLLNSDNLENTTTKGTAVTTDGRYHKTFGLVRDTSITCIEKARKIAPVKVIMVPGNHDSLSVWHLGDSLECYFHKYDDVEIDNSPRYRKYHQHGNVMLMFTHGDKGKKNDYPLLMATEQPIMFGSTKYREAHTGHTHQTKLDEQHGVRVRVLPALCPPDDWHSENAYVGNLRNAEAFIWNDEEGLVGMVFYCDDAQEPIDS